MRLIWQSTNPMNSLDESVRVLDLEGDLIMEVLIKPPVKFLDRVRMAVKVIAGETHILSTRLVDKDLEGILSGKEGS